MSATGGDTTLTWIGQAGYALEAPGGELCLIDPYLSEYVLEELGTPRIAPVVVDVETARPLVVAITHWHHDHLDLPTCQALAEHHPETIFAGPSSIVARLLGRGVARDRIVVFERGETVTVGPFTFHGTYARHEVAGFLTEDAMGLVVETGGTRILHSGDTEYDARCLAVRALGPFDVGIFVSNGSGGCMNGREAALMASSLPLGVAIPCHYGMWAPEGYGAHPGQDPAEAPTLDPQLFADTCAALGGPPARVLELGERFAVTPVLA
ncbi:MBL fold metallo-hydrolase [Conexibacter woesei]|uniref:MBL fold metallo-hydrolase n=1 Tax=Conexibacter woesei TaxID=191495 RepID=UPI0004026E74|nr:MBL fold metallo-hydrolase [Conexibacter woesei]